MNPMAQALMRPFGVPPQAASQPMQISGQMPQQIPGQPEQAQHMQPAWQHMGNQGFISNLQRMAQMQRGMGSPGQQQWNQGLGQSPFFGTMPAQRMPFGQ